MANNKSSTIKISNKETFVPLSLLKNIVESTTLPEQNIDEEDSELYFTTLHGYGKIVFKNGNDYEGNVRFGVLHSLPNLPSTMMFKDGTFYKGEMINNKITGKGEYRFVGGSVYYGEVLNGLRHGKGVYENADEEIRYEGDWFNGLKNGFGKLKIKDMNYEGEFSQGAKHKKGKLKWIKTGNYYEGEFCNNSISGNGYMIWMDYNEKFIGQWKENEQNGIGVHIWYEPKGEHKYLKNRYVGEWESGQRHGYGVFFYANGSKYEGLWEKNSKHGFGVFTFHDGSQYIGKFQHDKMIDFNNQGITQIDPSKLKQNTTDSFGKENKLAASNATVKIKKPLNEMNKKFGVIAEDPRENSEPPRTLLQNHNTSSKQNYQLDDPSKLDSTTSKVVQLTQTKKLAPIDKRQVSGLASSTTIQNKRVSQDVKTSSFDNPIDEIEEINSRFDQLVPNKIIKDSDANPFATLLDINDIIEGEPEVEKSMFEIQNLLLRYLSEMKTWYKIYSSGKEYDRLNESNNAIDSKKEEDSAKASQQPSKQAKSSLHKESINANPSIQKKDSVKMKDDLVITEGLNLNSDIGYAMEMKDLWRFIRDSGLLTPEFTLSEFNRLYFAGPRNFVEMFTCPEDLKEDHFYDYLYSMVQTGKRTFLSKYKRNEIFANYANSGKPVAPQYAFKNELFEFDIHSKRNIVLMRQFYESIVRMAYLRMNSSNESLSKKVKNLVENFIKQNAKLKSKKTNLLKEPSSLNSSTMNMLNDDQLNKVFEPITDLVFSNYEGALLKLFKDLFNKFKVVNIRCDLALRFRYLFEQVISKSNELKDVIDKYAMASFINKFHISKLPIMEENKYTISVYSYVDNLLDCELIFFEFCELIGFISKKLFVMANMPDTKEAYIQCINKVILIFKQAEAGVKTQDKYRYYYPFLKYHRELDLQLKNQKRLREEERRLENERMRWAKENVEMARYQDQVLPVQYVEDDEEEEDESYNR